MSYNLEQMLSEIGRPAMVELLERGILKEDELRRGIMRVKEGLTPPCNPFVLGSLKERLMDYEEEQLEVNEWVREAMGVLGYKFARP